MNPKREELLQILGGKICKHCEITDSRILQIDHIFGNGKEMPLSDTNILDIYLDNPYLAKTELQVLCCNCHRIKSIECGDLGRRKGESIPLPVKKKDIPKKYLDELEQSKIPRKKIITQTYPRNNLNNMDWYK